ncbi:MAG: MBL fold metallo-hydrolase [Chloroflexi bacterium]|nr:MBL fold metallo-hydrolase [Chloroflexota bacterium]
MKITFHGAARTVTGSQHLIEVNDQRLLLDCGLYHGKRKEAFERNRNLPFDCSTVDALVLSHAHIDHSGNIPNLVKSGFTGDIYCTFATRDLCSTMLLDSGHIQEKDAEYVNKKRARKNEPPVEPLYTVEDAVNSLDYFNAIGYHRQREILPGIHVTFLDAGHMLGSAITVLDIEDRDAGRDVRLVFSGDLGRQHIPIIRDPEMVDHADVLIMESTYGDRLHEDYVDSEKELERIVLETHGRGGAIIIPAFAVGRTQQLVYTLAQLMTARDIPEIPVFVDSPLAINATSVFRLHPECYDAEIRAYMLAEGDPFGFDQVRYTRSVEQSKELNFLREPFIVISASGMAEAGRILHHLKNRIEDPKNTVLIVGWQAPNTLGRRIVDQVPEVRIFGEEYKLNAQVEVINGFSGHADRDEMLEWAGAISKRPRQTFLVHGEEDSALALAGSLRDDAGFESVEVPELHQTFSIT